MDFVEFSGFYGLFIMIKFIDFYLYSIVNILVVLKKSSILVKDDS